MKLEVGQRALYRVSGDSQIREGEVVEYSPSGEYVNLWGNWAKVNQVEVLEELPARQIPPLTSGTAPEVTALPTGTGDAPTAPVTVITS